VRHGATRLGGSGIEEIGADRRRRVDGEVLSAVVTIAIPIVTASEMVTNLCRISGGRLLKSEVS
jgi:hypothetical protein